MIASTPAVSLPDLTREIARLAAGVPAGSLHRERRAHGRTQLLDQRLEGAAHRCRTRAKHENCPA